MKGFAKFTHHQDSVLEWVEAEADCLMMWLSFLNSSQMVQFSLAGELVMVMVLQYSLVIQLEYSWVEELGCSWEVALE